MTLPSDPEVLNDRYALGALLGRGGMGEVRMAHDRRLGRDVAVKFLRPDLASQPEVRDRFEAEARHAAQLTHPNVVLVLDSGEHNGQPYLVMECLPGHSLRDEMAKGPIDAATVASIARDVLAGLAAAHEVGIIHRDISPGNILITDAMGAKIADFGIAKAATEDASVTVVGQVLGTPAYLSPERLHGEPATPADDIYALGVVLYEALTGVRLFQGDSAVAIAHAVLSTNITPLRVSHPELPPTLSNAIDNAMERDVGLRTPTATAMLAQLEDPDPAGSTVAMAAFVADPLLETVALSAVSVAPAAAASVPVPWWERWRSAPRGAWLAVAAAVGVGVLLFALIGQGGGPKGVSADLTTTTTGLPTTITTSPPATQATVVTAVAPQGKGGDGKRGHGKG